MSRLDILTIKLDTLGEKIVSKSTLVNLIRDVLHDEPIKTLKNLRQNRKIKLIFKNYYYILSENERVNDMLNYFSFELVFGVLNKLNVKWYLSFGKGLEFNNLVWQSHKTFVIVNNSISRNMKILNTDFEFRKTKSKYITDFKQNKTKNRITLNLGSIEKIFIDELYFKEQVPLELSNAINVSKVFQILSVYPKGFQKKVRDLFR